MTATIYGTVRCQEIVKSSIHYLANKLEITGTILNGHEGGRPKLISVETLQGVSVNCVPTHIARKHELIFGASQQDPRTQTEQRGTSYVLTAESLRSVRWCEKRANMPFHSSRTPKYVCP